jgi:hypothetical protein
MKLLEFDQAQVATGYYNPSQDSYNARHFDDTRKPVLTLAILNRLKLMRSLKKSEALKRQDLLGIMYSPIEEPGGGGLGGF